MAREDVSAMMPMMATMPMDANMAFGDSSAEH